MFKIEGEIFKQLKHMHDPYNRQQEMEKKERAASCRKIPKDVPPFRSTVHGNRPLVKDQATYGLDDKAKKVLTERKARAKTATSRFPHETPFKPGMKYPGGTLNKLPEHLSDRTEGVPRRNVSKSKEEGKEVWKPNKWGLTRPTPSIILLPKNLRCGSYL
jgi:hypothetical protein